MSVYHAERVVGLGGVDWHKGCMRCTVGGLYKLNTSLPIALNAPGFNP
jgi:hypothetical protein